MSRDAVVVGINTYANSGMNLTAPAQDAEAIAKLLETYGDFKVKRLPKVRVSNFLAVLGASGSGKSSVVSAGLLYQLTLGQRLSGSENWEIKIIRPGEHPLKSLALAFVDKNL
ncbi:MAG: caspase family protein, partial [Nostocaceae cyanobacterium]|nr:caspase family protein [Nostocaceae cyanobacterium]